MALVPSTMLSNEPLFYGGDLSKGMTPEDFITRMEALRLTNNWNDAAAAAQAIGFLRGPASEWFNQGLPNMMQDKYRLALRAYTHFKEAFQVQYFKVRSSADVTTDWSNLRQLPSEKAMDFLARVAGALFNYRTHIGTEDEPADDRALLVDAINEGVRLVQDDEEYEMPNAIANPIKDAITAHAISNQKIGHHLVIRDLIIKLVANGLRHKALADLVRKEERKGSNMETIMTALGDADRALHLPTAGRIVNQFAKNSIPALGRIDAHEDLEDPEEEVDAVRPTRRAPKKTSGGRPLSEADKARRAANAERNKGKFCNYCRMKDSHEEFQCFKKKRDLRNKPADSNTDSIRQGIDSVTQEDKKSSGNAGAEL